MEERRTREVFKVDVFSVFNICTLGNLIHHLNIQYLSQILLYCHIYETRDRSTHNLICLVRALIVSINKVLEEMRGRISEKRNIHKRELERELTSSNYDHFH